MSAKGTLRYAVLGHYPRGFGYHVWQHCFDHTYHVDVECGRWEWSRQIPRWAVSLFIDVPRSYGPTWFRRRPDWVIGRWKALWLAIQMVSWPCGYCKSWNNTSRLLWPTVRTSLLCEKCQAMQNYPDHIKRYDPMVKQ